MAIVENGESKTETSGKNKRRRLLFLLWCFTSCSCENGRESAIRETSSIAGIIDPILKDFRNSSLVKRKLRSPYILRKI
ncbi:hypothetical protein CCACVL1_13623 [Corchorus capsularis]|uniref:Uncharacterized protein n=1 Tax=Corchorus capsularis TaxID=210143 RepID=A0A1R3IAE9_COCAP|nr:hypothetical protein CCACVL1_13623 [Corchorus capsularis]